MYDYDDAPKKLAPEREQELLNKLVDYISEYFNDGELYNILHNTLEMSHEDMEGLGFCLQDQYEISEAYLAERAEGDVKNPLSSHKTIDLIATYEELHDVPRADCLTYYFGDYGSHFFNHGVTGEQISAIYEKALADIEMDSDTFQRMPEFIYRGEIIGRMRDCLLPKELKVGETVLFVAPEPYGDPRDFALRDGRMLSIDATAKTCSIAGELFTMTDIPLHYVLGRYDPTITEKHYGFKCISPFFSENQGLVADYLHEAERKWNASLEQSQGQTQNMMI